MEKYIAARREINTFNSLAFGMLRAMLDNWTDELQTYRSKTVAYYSAK